MADSVLRRASGVSSADALRDVRIDARARLVGADVASPRSDADWLLAHVLGVSRGQLASVERLSAAQLTAYTALIDRRAQREPLQHIIGEAWFRALRIPIGPGVFVPRPETELLVDHALDEVRRLQAGGRQAGNGVTNVSVVDLCTGSGAIALALATEACRVDVVGVEIDARAGEWAQRSIHAYADDIAAAGSSVTLHIGDGIDAGVGLLANMVGRVDIVTVNPPYIPDAAIPRDVEVREFDPPVALYGGPDGLAVVRGLIKAAARLLKPGGLLVMEHGDEQGEDGGTFGVPAAMRALGYFATVLDCLDLNGRPRVTLASAKSAMQK